MLLLYSPPPPINMQFPLTVPVVFLIMVIATIRTVYEAFQHLSVFMVNADGFTTRRSLPG